MKYQYVVHNHDGGWDVKAEGASKATKHFDIQSKAKKFAKTIAKNQNTGIRVQHTDGTFGEEDTYGRDLFPPKG